MTEGSDQPEQTPDDDALAELDRIFEAGREEIVAAAGRGRRRIDLFTLGKDREQLVLAFGEAALARLRSGDVVDPELAQLEQGIAEVEGAMARLQEELATLQAQGGQGAGGAAEGSAGVSEGSAGASEDEAPTADDAALDSKKGGVKAARKGKSKKAG